PEDLDVFLSRADGLGEPGLKIASEVDRPLVEPEKVRLQTAPVAPEQAFAELMIAGNPEITRVVVNLGLSVQLPDFTGEVPAMVRLVAEVFALLQDQALEIVQGIHTTFQFESPLRSSSLAQFLELFQTSPTVHSTSDFAPASEQEDQAVVVQSTRKAVRPIVKIFIGLCLGLLFWGFIRHL
ncbi:MAG: hypothetical protein ACYTFD_05425, partial [Planctomycetota bacterium]